MKRVSVKPGNVKLNGTKLHDVATFLFGAVSVGAFVATACSSSTPQRSDEPGGAATGDPAGTSSSAPPSFLADDGGKGCMPAPGNYDFPGDGCDNDGDGTADNAAKCDDNLSVTGSAQDFAKALGVCKTVKATDKGWGLVSATYTRGYQETKGPTNDTMHGILGKFGTLQPREGKRIGVLSSGFAREYDDAQGTSTPFKSGANLASIFSASGTAPPGFPKAANGCATASDVHNVSAVKLEIKVPDNAKGISFDFNFFSSEWPDYICSTFNDAFIAYMQSSVFNNGKPDNISFDAQNNPVSVNNGFFDRCTPGTKLGCKGGGGIFSGGTQTSQCPGGEAELQGTGFYDKGSYCGGKQSTGGGATGWLTSTAPVKPGEVITLEFMIWNTGDTALDSSVLLDHLTWEPGEVIAQTVRPN